jgi:hypothetical protein
MGVGPHAFAGVGPREQQKNAEGVGRLTRLLDHYRVGTRFSTYAICSVGSGYDAIGELPL